MAFISDLLKNNPISPNDFLISTSFKSIVFRNLFIIFEILTLNIPLVESAAKMVADRGVEKDRSEFFVDYEFDFISSINANHSIEPVRLSVFFASLSSLYGCENTSNTGRICSALTLNFLKATTISR